jgi:hypothetical protein
MMQIKGRCGDRGRARRVCLGFEPLEVGRPSRVIKSVRDSLLKDGESMASLCRELRQKRSRTKT